MVLVASCCRDAYLYKGWEVNEKIYRAKLRAILKTTQHVIDLNITLIVTNFYYLLNN